MLLIGSNTMGNIKITSTMSKQMGPYQENLKIPTHLFAYILILNYTAYCTIDLT
jgi:hypothetical protein